jgi:hypothetical protein
VQKNLLSEYGSLASMQTVATKKYELLVHNTGVVHYNRAVLEASAS